MIGAQTGTLIEFPFGFQALYAHLLHIWVCEFETMACIEQLGKQLGLFDKGRPDKQTNTQAIQDRRSQLKPPGSCHLALCAPGIHTGRQLQCIAGRMIGPHR